MAIKAPVSEPRTMAAATTRGARFSLMCVLNVFAAELMLPLL
jgi:hypothetical protein